MQSTFSSVADSDVELREGGGTVFLLALPAFLPSVIFFYSKWGSGPLDPSPRSVTGLL